MDLQQLVRSVFWNPATVTQIPSFVLSLTVAALLGAIVGQAYVHFGQSLSNRRVFARNFLLVTVTTTLVITIVKASLALSLGLVGALSIVRFRAAIKEPEELAFLFLAISVGLGLGAGQALLTIVALVAIIGLIAIRKLVVRRSPDQPNLYVVVSSPAPRKIRPGQILEALAESGASAALKRFDETAEALEVSFAADFPKVASLEAFSQRLRELSPDATVRCLDDRGLGV